MRAALPSYLVEANREYITSVLSLASRQWTASCLGTARITCAPLQKEPLARGMSNPGPIFYAIRSKVHKSRQIDGRFAFKFGEEFAGFYASSFARFRNHLGFVASSWRLWCYGTP